jgi:hypothetical protein
LKISPLNFIIVWVIVWPKRAATSVRIGLENSSQADVLILRALNDFPSRAILGYRGWRCGGQRGAAGAYDCQR